MRITLKFSGNIYNLMRAFGYHPEGIDKKTGQMIFARRLGARNYPRLHVYIEQVSRGTTINLHLDQKKPIYKGASAHAAEYEGEVVEKEAERIKKIFRGR